MSKYFVSVSCYKTDSESNVNDSLLFKFPLINIYFLRFMQMKIV